MLRSSRILFVVLIALLVAGCVENRKVLLLQKDDVNRDMFPKDSVVRAYGVDSTDYRLQPEDIVSVRFESLTPKEFDFFNQNAMQTSSMNLQGGNALLLGDIVDQRGEIPFPFIGKVKVSGFTIFEVQDQLQAIAVKYLDAPIVKVRLLNFRITTLGEFNKEGATILNNNKVTLMEAIGWAGGLTDLADRENIKLVRTEHGRTTIRYINLLDEKFINSPLYYVHQNDILIAPPLRQRPYRKYFGQNLALVISSLSLLLLTINFIHK